MVDIKKFGKMGRGLVANRKIKKGTVIEESPVIVLDDDDWSSLGRTVLNLYWFLWNETGNEHGVCLALGVGSLFNHSDKPNTVYKANFKTKTLIFKATRDIKKGEQLFVNYGYDPVPHYDSFLELKKSKADAKERDKSELEELKNRAQKVSDPQLDKSI